MKVRLLFIPFLLLCIVSSCITPRDTNFLQDIDKNYPMEQGELDYKIIPGDQLRLTIYTLDVDVKKLFSVYSRVIRGGQGGQGQNGEGLTVGDYLEPNVLNVYSDGCVKIPYVGKIAVSGLSILEAKKVISEKLSMFFSKETKEPVTVDVVLANRYFSVLGEAGASRVAMRVPRVNIYQALANSGTISNVGDIKNVKIIRQTSNGTEVKTFDLRSKDVVDSEFYYIQPNDVIYVQQLQRRFFGEITSFTGIFGMITTVIATALGIVVLVDKLK